MGVDQPRTDDSALRLEDPVCGLAGEFWADLDDSAARDGNVGDLVKPRCRIEHPASRDEQRGHSGRW